MVTFTVSDKTVLGRQTEHGVTTIQFPIRKYVEKHGAGGTFHLWHQRSTDEHMYPVVFTQDAEYVYWVPTATDTAYEGFGRAVLDYTFGTSGSADYRKAVEEVFTTRVEGIPDATNVVPTPYTPWVTQVESFADRAEAAAEEAESAVEEKFGDMTATATTLTAGSSATATYNSTTNVMSFGIPKGDPGDPGEPGTTDFDDMTNKPSYNGTAMTHATNIPEVKTSAWDGKYTKPSAGIPKSDLDSSVQTSLGKADTALQSETYTGTVTSVGVSMNGASKGTVTTSGVIDLGTVLTEHQTLSDLGVTASVTELNYVDGVTSAIQTQIDGKLATSLKGSANGLAELDATGKVPSAQLPSYVDDVLEYDSMAQFPATGESGKIYAAKDTNKTYRWGGSEYVEISPSLALGETSSTAYRGDRGKTAYDHSQATGNPHNTTLGNLGVTATASELNVLDGITASTTELNYVDGVTSGIQGQLNSASTDIANIAEKVDPAVPSYYFTDNYLQNKCATINSHDNDCSYGGLIFAWITDTHWDSNAKKSPALMNYVCEHTSLRNIVFGGDAFNAEDTKDLAKYKYNWFRKAFQKYRGYAWMPIIGNHELNNPGASAERLPITLSAAEAYGLVAKENENIINVLDEYSYYVDDTNTKVRSIFVGCTYPTPISPATAAAVVACIGTLPNGYKVILFSHHGMDGTGSTGTIANDFQPIVTALEAISGKVIACFVGNRHADGYVLSTGGVPIIATTCDALQEDGGLSRTSGTITEQAFDIVQYSPSLSKVFLTRIGAGQNREYNCGTIKYVGIECGIDNATYETRNGTYSDVVESSYNFVSILADTELTTSRQISFCDCVVREFDDPNATSFDYWSPFGGHQPRSFTSSRRYFAIALTKTESLTYLHDDTNNVYIFKGSDVP